MKLLLLAPAPAGRGFWSPLMHAVPNHSLLQVARLTPREVEIEIVDENHSPVDWEKRPDLVGITAMSFQAKRAFVLGDEFRRRGSKVVMGGFHPALDPEGCLEHSDAVVIGEAEGIWPRVLSDFQKGKLEKYYQAEHPSDLKNLPPPRFDLIGLRHYLFFNNYLYLPVSATRGCPYNCDFCSIRRFYRAGFRTRPVEEVIEDIRAGGIKKSYFLSDDNFIGDRAYARELLQAMIGLNVEWLGQCDISIGRDPELLALARRSGLTAVYLGLETLNQENLSGFRKGHLQVKDYPEYLRNMREAGIQVMASVMFGFDHDGPEVFRQMIDFLEKHHVTGYLAYILNPMPGSDFSYRLGQEGRYLDVDLKDWDLYDGTHALFRPRKMSAQELEEGFWRAYFRFYSLRSIARRYFRPPNLDFDSVSSLIYSFRMMAWGFAANILIFLTLRMKRLHPFTRY